MDTVTHRFEITGMHCPSCSRLVKMSLEDLEGVVSAEVDLETGLAVVTSDPAKVSDDEVVGEIVNVGYSAVLLAE